jgi:hypothetical protein
MGRQVAFRAYRGDLDALEEAFASYGASFLAYYQTPGLKQWSTLGLDSNPDPIVWLARPKDFDEIRLKSIAGKSYWLVDQFRSPVVELSRGGWSDKEVHGGRLHFMTNYFDEDDRKREFSEGFIHWANGLLGIVRRRFKRDETGFYVGPQAREFLAASANDL